MIGLMDCNNFFVSCERLFRPDLVGKPVAVLSSNDGCIVARSQEVKDLRISMGAPLFQIHDEVKRHGITLFSSNFALYRDVSTRVMRALSEEFEYCEIYSVDEAFFKLPNNISVAELSNIRTRIIQKTGIPVSIGVAPTKTLAKVAGRIAKTNGRHRKSTIMKKGVDDSSDEDGRLTMSTVGVCVMGMEEWQEIAKNTSCGTIWGIGRQTSAFLTEKQINTAYEFMMLPRPYVRQTLGVIGERLQMELSGIEANVPGDTAHTEQESYTSTRSFHKPIHEKAILMSALGYHTARVAEKLREDACVAHRVGIVLRGSRYGHFAHQSSIQWTTLVVPTHDTFALTKEISHLLDLHYDSKIPYKKAGVIVCGIEPHEFSQHSLFMHDTRTEELSTLQDSLNQKFGRDTLRSGVTLSEDKWQERKELKSPEYTTQWSEIACVKAV